MRQFSLFSDEEFDDLVLSQPAVPEKKEKAKKEKKASKKAGKGTGADIDVLLPVEVYGRGFQLTMNGFGTKKGVELLEVLCEEHAIHELKVKGMKATYIEQLGAVFLCDDGVVKTENNALVSLPVVIADGGVCLEIDKEYLELAEDSEDEITLAMILDKWIEANPSYEGCSLSYNSETGVAYPVWDKKTGNAFHEVFFGSKMCCVDEFDSNSINTQVVSEFFGESFPLSASLVGKDTVYLSFKEDKNAFYLKDAVGYAQTKVAEVKYELPLTAFVATWGESYQLVAEHFEGRNSVKLEEIKEKLAELYPVCSCLLDTHRKVDAVYLKDINKLSLMLVSGTKGATAYGNEAVLLIETAEDLKKIISNKKSFHGVFCPDKRTHTKVDVYPCGAFLGKYGTGLECCKIKSLDFERTLPRIPHVCLEGIISYFREQLPNEAIVKIYYNQLVGDFYFVRGVGQATENAIHYSFDREDALLPGVIKVMEIHSHGKHEAFFSLTDDTDELHIPGVYGVIGNVDTKKPSMLFRACSDGVYTRVPWFDLFC